MKNLVTTKWLENNLEKENLVIFDVRYDMEADILNLIWENS